MCAALTVKKSIIAVQHTAFFTHRVGWHWWHRVGWHWWHWPITMSQCLCFCLFYKHCDIV